MLVVGAFERYEFGNWVDKVSGREDEDNWRSAAHVDGLAEGVAVDAHAAGVCRSVSICGTEGEGKTQMKDEGGQLRRGKQPERMQRTVVRRVLLRHEGPVDGDLVDVRATEAVVLRVYEQWKSMSVSLSQ